MKDIPLKNCPKCNGVVYIASSLQAGTEIEIYRAVCNSLCGVMGDPARTAKEAADLYHVWSCFKKIKSLESSLGDSKKYIIDLEDRLNIPPKGAPSWILKGRKYKPYGQNN